MVILILDSPDSDRRKVRAGTSASCKTRFVLALVNELVGGGHRVLVFSQSRLMLNILAGGLQHAYLRIDGSVSSAAERQVGPRQPCLN